MNNIKSISLLLAIMLVMTLGAIPTSAAPTATVTEEASDAANGGQISEINFTDIVSETTKWQGYYGNVTSAANGIVLKDTNTMYQWSYTPSLLTGTVFATQDSSMSASEWLSLNASDTADLDSVFSFGTAPDNVTNTFSSSKSLNISGRSTSGPRVTTNVNSIADTTDWYTVALNKTASSAQSDFVFAGIINNNATAYDNTMKDYQMMVPVKDGTTPTYYFYVELK